MKIVGLLIAVVITALFTPYKAEAVIVGKSECGSNVILASGDSLEVTLAGNITTGFQWDIEGPIPGIIKQDAKPSYTSDSSLAGSGGVFRFSFKAADEGEESLTMVYKRSWEQGLPPADKCSFRITVKKRPN